MRLLVVLLLSIAAQAAEVLSWEQGLDAMAAGKDKAFCVYIGREKSMLLQLIRSGAIDTAGVPVIRLGSEREVRNPYSGRQVSGSRMIMNLTGPLNDLTGGSLLFFDADGVLLPQFTIIQNFHRNRPEVLALYCALVADPLRDKLSLAEYARYKGMPIGQTLLLEAKANRHKDFSWLFREVGSQEVYFRGVSANGTVLDPRTDATITVITRDPNGEVFLAQMREYWEKLAVPSGPTLQRPPLVVLGPVGASYPALDAQGITYTAGVLTTDQLKSLSTPMTVLPGAGERKAMEIHGFIPGQVVGETILDKAAGLLTNIKLLHPDIPLGDLDVEATP